MHHNIPWRCLAMEMASQYVGWVHSATANVGKIDLSNLTAFKNEFLVHVVEFKMLTI